MPRGTWGHFGEIRGAGGGKNGVLEHKSGHISETRKDRGKVTMGAYSNSATLFPIAPSPTPYGLPFPKIGVRTPPKTPIAI